MGNFVLVCWNCRAVSAAESYRLWCLAQYHTYWVDLCALSFFRQAACAPATDRSTRIAGAMAMAFAAPLIARHTSPHEAATSLS